MRISIIHSLPLEYYPPAMNFVLWLGSQHEYNVQVITSWNDHGRKTFSPNNVLIKRSLSMRKANSLRKVWYGLLNLIVSSFDISRFRPDVIIYYETISLKQSLLCVLFTKAKIVNINHEYFSHNWYKTTGSKLTWFLHQIETNYIYKKCTLITQTNVQRIKLFLRDNSELEPFKLSVLPNHPPKNWIYNAGSYTKSDSIINRTKLLYIGVCDLEYCYLEEVCTWVLCNELYTLDIYSFNIPDSTLSYLESLRCERIQIFTGGIEYYDIPRIAGGYDIGLVLYKAITDNYRYNVPNKFYEYLVCGLEVWYSDKLLSPKSIPDFNGSSGIVSIDFTCIDKSLMVHRNTVYEKSNSDIDLLGLTCEKTYSEFAQLLFD